MPSQTMLPSNEGRKKSWRMILLCLTLLVLTPAAASAQDETSDQDARERGRQLFQQLQRSEPVRNEDVVLELFYDVVGDASQSTMKLMEGRRQLALATVVSEDGFLITKASELTQDFFCQFPDGTTLPAEIIGIDKAEDIALLKVERDGLIPANWESETTPAVGSWVVSVGQNPFPLTIGVVSVDPRPIAAPQGVMGVFLGDADPTGALIGSLIDDSPAEKAGLEVDDVVTHVDGVEILNYAELKDLVGSKRPGEIVNLTIKREDEIFDVLLELASRADLDPSNQRSLQQNELGGPLSEVREGFSEVLQHDSGIGRHECGGPVVGLSGKPIGINIARAGRVNSYVLTAKTLLPIVEKLKSGDYSPAVVNKQLVSKLEEQAAGIQKRIDEEITPKLKSIEEELTKISLQEEELAKQVEAEELTQEEADAKLEELTDQKNELLKSQRALKYRAGRLQRDIDSINEKKEFYLSGSSD